MDQLKALDLVLFRGVDFVSSFIRRLQSRRLHLDRQETYSHVALVVTSEILDDPRVKKGEYYLWESTMSGPINDDVLNVDGRSFFGVQLRKMSDVLISCKRKGGEFQLLSIKVDPTQYKSEFTKTFNKYNNTRYDTNLFSLLSALYPTLRPLRKYIEKYLKTDGWLFCSELCALTYKEIGIMPDVEPKNVVPQDFLFDNDKEVLVELFSL